MAHGEHYRRLAYAALDLSDPAAQADAVGVLARALLDAASALEAMEGSSRRWEAHARNWHRRFFAQYQAGRERMRDRLRLLLGTATPN